MQDDKFSLFVPVDIIEKADDKKGADGLPEKLLIAGVASTPKYGYDKDDQRLLVNGFDYQPFLKSGFFNIEHAYQKTKDASMIVGEPTSAFVKGDEFYVEGELYKDNPKAVALYKLGQTLKKAGSKRKIGYSIEGSVVAKDPRNPKDITKAVITHCAITISPKCDGTQMIIKGGDSYETQEGSDLLIDIVDEGVRYTVDKDLNIIEKAMMAGSVTGRDTTDQSLTQEPLKEESLDTGKKKKKKAGEDMYSKAEVFYELISKYNMDDESCRNVWDLCLAIEKGGEGSRGGKVIGHTKSGKPIYHHETYSNENYSDYSKEDHADAAKVHDEKAQHHFKNKEQVLAQHHGSQSIDHKRRSEGKEPFHQNHSTKWDD